MTRTRVAGILYLFIIVLGAIGQIAIRGSIVVPGDAAATVHHLAASASLWRLGILGDLLMHVLDVPVMVILYTLFKPVDKTLALTALVFNIVQTSVLVVNKVTLVIPLLVLDDPSLASLFLQWHNYGFGVGLIFFGFTCLLYGLMMFRSGTFPRTLGMLVGLAGLSYLVNSAALLLAPEISGAVLPVLVLAFVGELAFSLYLILRGRKVS